MNTEQLIALAGLLNTIAAAEAEAGLVLQNLVDIVDDNDVVIGSVRFSGHAAVAELTVVA